MGGGNELGLLITTPPCVSDPALAIAACRAGAWGVLNLEFSRDTGPSRQAIERLVRLARRPFGVQINGDEVERFAPLLTSAPPDLDLIILAGLSDTRIPEAVDRVKRWGRRTWVTVHSLSEALAAECAGADAIIAKGHESGGWVGDETAFVLLQRLRSQVGLPIWVQGGIGLHTAPACLVGGATGVVLDNQLLLVKESPISEAARSRLAAFDGSETVCLGSGFGAGFRCYARPDLSRVEELRRLELSELADLPEPEARAAWRSAVQDRVGRSIPDQDLWPLGQDAVFAAPLARRFKTVGGVLAALRESIRDHIDAADQAAPIAVDAPLARSHGTTYPIVQGPMTRVSDRAEFAGVVAEAGALPFLALALLREGEVRELLRQTRERLGDRPWGVGILGFVPTDLRAEQLRAVREFRPPFALIAGGRPDQARVLEADGTQTYLHVPSPGLLNMFLEDGAKRFVFEGRECGGHVGPRTSFVLWESMIAALQSHLESPRAGHPAEFHVLFAGGIHDAISAAMVATLAGPLAARGVKIGVLIGTAYLFTEEAVRTGAIQPGFQAAALNCSNTAVLESGPGHATRCVPSPFISEFERVKRDLARQGLASDEFRHRLEMLNIGRLRIAAKGVDRNPAYQENTAVPKLVSLDPGQQWQQGMYMIGQVAALRNQTCTLAELHDEIVSASQRVAACASIIGSTAPPTPPPCAVAVVGMATIVPGASDLRAYWENILNKVDAIKEVPPERWDWRKYYDPDRNAPDKVYSRWGGFISEYAFDPLTFGMPPSTLKSIEPFQLLALAVVREALSDAGYAERPFPRDRTSVILGAGGGGADLTCGYMVRSSLFHLFGEPAAALAKRIGDGLPEWTEDSFAGLLMNVAAGRVANRFDLGGVNYTVDAACASSLAAVYLGVRDLEARTSDVVIVGGVDAIQNPFAFLCFSKTQALSPTGRCRTFDEQADGIAISEGFAAIVLKRLEDAERDGDRIYAVIRGVGGSSDGRDRGLTAPRPEGQIRALERAYAQAGYSPATVELIEAHGTGTVAGDQAEIQSLTRFFENHQATRQSCAVGSVKSMIGHTKATAGVAGLAKVALALHHRILPPTLGVTRPNPRARFEQSPFYVNTETRPWIHGGKPFPRRAGVSAFGFGGTNFHVSLEEYSESPLLEEQNGPTLATWPAELFVWSDSTRAGLRTRITHLRTKLESGARPGLLDLAHTLHGETPAAGPRLAIVATNLDDLIEKLRHAEAVLDGTEERFHSLPGVHFAAQPLEAEGRLAFLFPGQGSQQVNMGRDLAIVFPEVRSAFDRADAVLADRLPLPLSRSIFPPPAFTAESQRLQQMHLNATELAQPALGAFELALLDLLCSLGIRPDQVGGHSYGEFVALAAAGCFGRDDLLRLSEARGRFMHDVSREAPGAMVAVEASTEELQALLHDSPELTVANRNAPRQTVLSGSGEAVDRLVARCHERGLTARRLAVACGFHSPLVAPAKERLSAAIGDTPLHPPVIPVYSNTTGVVHSSDPSEIAAILAEHLAQPVEFVREIEAMYKAGARIFLEVGPKQVLTGLVKQILGARPFLAIPIDVPGQHGLIAFLNAIAALFSEGTPVHLDRLTRGRSARKLNLDRLDEEHGQPRVSATTWLVHGGGIRPAHTPPRTGFVPVPIALPDTKPASGTEPVAPFASLPVPNSAALPPAPSTISRDPARPDLIQHFQQVMQRFLQTQETVMRDLIRSQGRIDPSLPPSPGVTHPAAPPAPSQATVAPPERRPASDPAPEPRPASSSNGPTVPAFPDPSRLTESLVAIVSERTGYPAELLNLDADLESDLGIDSIKRVEIVGTLVRSISWPGGRPPDLEQLSSSRSLRQLIARLAESVPTPSQPATAEAGSPEPVATPNREPSENGSIPIQRFLVRPALADPVRLTTSLDRSGVVVVVNDGRHVASHLIALLKSADFRVAFFPPPESRDAAAALVEQVHREHGSVSALIHLAALQPDLEGIGFDSACWHRRIGRELIALFQLVQGFQADLETSAGRGGSAVIAATGLGGSFATDGFDDRIFPGHGALVGFLKTLQQEWPRVRVKAVDFAADEEPATIAHGLFSELQADDGLVEVGYRAGQRIRLELVPTPITPPELAPSEGAVVLITGGAKGITCETALALAARAHLKFIIVGRTELPKEPEDPETAGLNDASALKRALIAQLSRNGSTPSAAQIETHYRRLLSGREVRKNLDRLLQTGSSVSYHACDVRDDSAFAALIDQIYERHGRIDIVLHGAGVIEDRLVHTKTIESFERVFWTKVSGALVLASRLRPETLQTLVFFSSVSGRFGNRGQGDYAAANEVLNKLAQVLDRQWTARVVAMNWGPWQTTGMASADVLRRFQERGVALVTVPEGCRHFLAECTGGRKGEVEVLIGGLKPAQPQPPPSQPPPPQPTDRTSPGHTLPTVDLDAFPLLAGRARLNRLDKDQVEIDLVLHMDQDQYLDHHRLDGRPVFPFACALELMAEAAAAGWPDRELIELRQCRVLKGIVMDHGCYPLRVLGRRVTSPDRPDRIELRVIAGDHPQRVHFQATALLGERSRTGRVDRAAGAESRRRPIPPEERVPFPLEIEDAYREWLFHGPCFQGIRAIEASSPSGAIARVSPSSPSDCLTDHRGGHWLIDPIVLDCAAQMQLLWARQFWGVTLLPAAISRCTRLSTTHISGSLNYHLRIHPESQEPLCLADHEFTTPEGELIGFVTGFEGTGSRALNRLGAR